MEKMEQLVAFLFQRSGKKVMRDSAIYAALSYELGWLTPAQSMVLIKECLDKGLLKEVEGGYTPAFEYESIEIPLGFKINGSEFEVPHEKGEKELLPSIISEIEGRGMKRESAEKEIRRISEKERVIPEVAALILAREKGIEISKFIEKAWGIIKSM